jgi:uncharacterized Fe-S cluster-containing MiaB family protein
VTGLGLDFGYFGWKALICIFFAGSIGDGWEVFVTTRHRVLGRLRTKVMG